jgi:molybdate transport system permease protein
MPVDPGPVLLTFKLASVTAAALFLAGLPLSYWLAFSKARLRPAVEAVVAMPLVLPPTVIGFYLLVLLGRGSLLGGWIERVLGARLVFSFGGLVAASVIYSLPFMVQPLQSGFRSVPASLIEASLTLGKTRLATLARVILPNMKSSILTGLVLSFAHTVGEFGVVLMIGGSIPGRTRVASIAIYDEVQSLNYGSAHFYAFVLFLVTFSILLCVYAVNRRFSR